MLVQMAKYVAYIGHQGNHDLSNKKSANGEFISLKSSFVYSRSLKTR